MEIELADVSKTYRGGVVALESVSARFGEPNFIGLLGPNGAGKTTLIKLLTLGCLPTKGEILLDGVPLAEREKALKGSLGYLPQEYGLYEDLTVFQFLDYVAVLKSLVKNRKECIDSAMALCGLTEKKNKRISTLSGGYKQRVGIAQALLGEPDLLILDEPTAGLDPEERMKLRNVFARQARNRIVILSTHIIEDVHSVCNRIIVLNKGRVQFDGAPDALIKLAEGHVGTLEVPAAEDAAPPPGVYEIVSETVSQHRVHYRVMGHTLPPEAAVAQPSLEDAYLYALMEK